MTFYFKYHSYKKDHLKEFTMAQKLAIMPKKSAKKTEQDLFRAGKLIINGEELDILQPEQQEAVINSITENPAIRTFIQDFGHQDGFLKMGETQTKMTILSSPNQLNPDKAISFGLDSALERKESSFAFKRIDANTVEIIEKFCLPSSITVGREEIARSTKDGGPIARMQMVSRISQNQDGSVSCAIKAFTMEGRDKLAVLVLGDKRSFVRKIINKIQEKIANWRQAPLNKENKKSSKRRP